MLKTAFHRILLASVFSTSLFATAQAGEARQSIVLAGGCFWGMEAVFQHVKGVSEAIPGYAGGDAGTATYNQVSNGTTGHAEVVKVTFDPSQVSLETLLKVYFVAAHNPTQLNYQGPDHGTQYRSAIFFAAPEQQKAATEVMNEVQAQGNLPGRIVTTLEPLTKFYPAEAYHINYAARHPRDPYIVINDLPRVESVRQNFPALYVDQKS